MSNKNVILNYLLDLKYCFSDNVVQPFPQWEVPVSVSVTMIGEPGLALGRLRPLCLEVGDLEREETSVRI